MTKRANGEGSKPIKRKDGRWMARYTAYTSKGPKRKAVYGHTRDEASVKLHKALAGGPIFDAENITVGDYLERWLSDSVENSVKEGTFLSHRTHVRNHLTPAVGRMRLDKLTAAHLQSLYRAKLDDGFAAQTIVGIHSTVSKALKQAEKWDLIRKNPAANATPPRPQKTKMKALSSDEARRVLEAARGHRFYALWVLAITTGARHGELLALRWDDLTLRDGSGEMAIQRSYSRSKPKREGGETWAMGTTKTGKSRVVSLGDHTTEALKGRRNRQREEKLAYGPDYQETGFVFTSAKGTPVHQENSGKYWRDVARTAGILDDVRFHDLRHTAATLALSSGVAAKVVQEMLGHTNISQTLDTYSHVLPTLQRNAANVLDSELF